MATEGPSETPTYGGGGRAKEFSRHRDDQVCPWWHIREQLRSSNDTSVCCVEKATIFSQTCEAPHDGLYKELPSNVALLVATLGPLERP
jgi:hypothetical protein